MNKTSTGHYSTGHYSTGNNSTGNCSTGDCSTGDCSTGYGSTGYGSTGDYSTGNCSIGHWSTGNNSTGHYSTGDYSTGDNSTGHYSTGDWSISTYSTGNFSTEDYSGYGAFDKPCTPEEWNKAVKPNFLFFTITEWISEDKMSDKEKEKNKNYKTTKGYLKVYDYQEAWKISWDKKEDKETQLNLLTSLPNFNWDKFTQISGLTESYMRGNDDVAQAIKLLQDKGLLVDGKILK